MRHPSPASLRSAPPPARGGGIQVSASGPISCVFPAIDIMRSGTRKDELLVEKGTLAKTYVLRRILSPMGTVDAIEFLLEKLRQSKNNGDFFESMNT